MLDFLVTNATLPDGRTGMSLAVQDGRFVEVAQARVAPARETLDAQGLLAIRSHVDTSDPDILAESLAATALLRLDGRPGQTALSIRLEIFR